MTRRFGSGEYDQVSPPWDLPVACALVIVGVVMTVCGVIAVLAADGLPYLLLVVLGVVAAMAGERLILSTPTVTSQTSFSRPTRGRTPPHARTGPGGVFGIILGSIVALVCVAWLGPKVWNLGRHNLRRALRLPRLRRRSSHGHVTARVAVMREGYPAPTPESEGPKGPCGPIFEATEACAGVSRNV
jgi:hypothetical protein